ncbi:MAG: hypothetical protein JWQ66_4268 [Mucilaginibacter sp.]|nr:hypothetical protein [Mucilaginibacter sp.]
METNERTAPLNGKEGAEIDLKVAADWAKNHRHHNPDEVISQFFGREILQKLLDQPDCVGIRFYYGNSKSLGGWQRFMKKSFRKPSGEPHLIITGVTKEGTDQLPGPSPVQVEAFSANVAGVAAPAVAQSQSVVGEQSVPCPGGIGCPQNVLTGGA